MFWAGLYGVVAGDEIRLLITDQQGQPFIERDIIQEESRDRQFYYTGRKLNDALKGDTYIGTVTVRRKDFGERTLSKTIKIQ